MEKIINDYFGFNLYNNQINNKVNETVEDLFNTEMKNRYSNINYKNIDYKTAYESALACSGPNYSKLLPEENTVLSFEDASNIREKFLNDIKSNNFSNESNFGLFIVLQYLTQLVKK